MPEDQDAMPEDQDAMPEDQDAMPEDQDAMPEDQDEKRGITLRRRVRKVSRYSGPIPRAEEFARYEEVLPGSADRLISMAEREQAFTISFHNKALVAATLVAIVTIAALVFILTLEAYAFVVAALAIAQALPPITDFLKGISDNRMAMKEQELDIQIRQDHHELEIQIRQDIHELKMKKRLGLSPGSDDDSSPIPPRLVSENEQSDDKEGSSKD